MKPRIPSAATEAPNPRPQQRNDCRPSASALAIAVVAHILIILLLALWIISNGGEPPSKPLAIHHAPADSAPDPDSQFIRSLRQKPQRIKQPAPTQIASLSPQAIAVPPPGPPEFARDHADEFGAPFSETSDKSKGQSGSGRARGGSVEFFGQRDHAERVVFIVDFSTSMKKDQRLILLKKELRKALASLPEGLPFNIIYYSDIPWIGDSWQKEMRDRLEPKKVSWRTASGAERRLTSMEITNMRAEGSTFWMPPLKLALAMNPKPDLIWLLSDGDAVDRRDLIRNLDRLVGDEIRINTIGLELGGEPFQALVDIADMTGGKFGIIIGGKQHYGKQARQFTNPIYGKAEN